MAKKKTKPDDVGKTIELEDINIILKIPKEAVALEVTASLILDGELRKVGHNLSVSDIRDARQAFLDNVEDGDDYDARYVLTEEGMAYLEQLKEQREVGS